MVIHKLILSGYLLHNAQSTVKLYPEDTLCGGGMCNLILVLSQVHKLNMAQTVLRENVRSRLVIYLDHEFHEGMDMSLVH